MWYIVIAGDSLFRIAQRFGTTVEFFSRPTNFQELAEYVGRHCIFLLFLEECFNILFSRETLCIALPVCSQPPCRRWWN